ncbi:hypothetical protein ACELLULO517_18235 [Acidisoma cellulosilytica]|uniref:Uncharacterized protein n=1 Tax=Acidisoma cellulosilyticum TaxID=2802395 RepID=A0A963Z499_9PROT|nr:hypothetical protein [Acidisoma cellulosilyticum]MCB8882191.1 hypothetical protein [Acidisoma cellulosilyticum]
MLVKQMAGVYRATGRPLDVGLMVIETATRKPDRTLFVGNLAYLNGLTFLLLLKQLAGESELYDFLLDLDCAHLFERQKSLRYLFSVTISIAFNINVV